MALSEGWLYKVGQAQARSEYPVVLEDIFCGNSVHTTAPEIYTTHGQGTSVVVSNIIPDQLYVPLLWHTFSLLGAIQGRNWRGHHLMRTVPGFHR